jgi:hypothetical protein
MPMSIGKPTAINTTERAGFRLMVNLRTTPVPRSATTIV